MVLLNIGKGVEPLNFTSYNDIVPMKQQERELELQELAGLNPSESFSEVRDELARELISDIRRDIDEWCEWFCYYHLTEDYISERKKDLLVLCDVVEKRISK